MKITCIRILVVVLVLVGVFAPETAFAGCVPGEFSAAPLCLPCPPGSFCDGFSVFACPAGTTSSGGAAFCSPIVGGASINFVPDADNDGVNIPFDNCPNVPNAGQENTWGGHEGNACDRNYYDSGTGVKIFKQKPSGLYAVYANCQGTVCEQIAQIDPSGLGGIGAYPDFLRLFTESRWFVDVYFLGEDTNGSKVYQVNVYAPGGLLMDDGFFVYIAPDGTDSYIPHFRG